MDESARYSELIRASSTLRGGRRETQDRFSGYFRNSLNFSNRPESSDCEDFSIPNESAPGVNYAIQRPRKPLNTATINLNPENFTQNNQSQNIEFSIAEELREISSDVIFKFILNFFLIFFNIFRSEI